MTRRRLGDILVEDGVLSSAELHRYLALQAAEPPRQRRRLGRILLEDERVTEITLAMALAEANGLEFVDLSAERVDETLARSMPKVVAQRALVLPISLHDDMLRVAAADPLDVLTLDDVRMALRQTHRGTGLEVVVAPESQIRRRLEEVWSEGSAVEALHRATSEAVTEAEEQGAVTAVHQILSTAVQLGASDIHVEPLADSVRVRMRVDGSLRKVMSLPAASHARLTSRVKIMADLDIAVKRVPQDGRARIVLDGVTRNIRVSTLPTLHGEKIVIRLLPEVGDLPGLAALGLHRRDLDTIHHVLRGTQGLVLITGPTGSGKTTTLYSAVHEVVTGDRNVITLEEPVEIELPGVAQVQIDEKSGMTFAAGLRSVLRQDPDIIMVGEVRDQATAELAVRAALTGHLVLATVHTTDAASAVLRLVDMGVPRYLIASSLRLVIAQRLVRKPCRYCAVQQTPDAQSQTRLGLSEEQAQRFVVGQGCAHCDGIGYRGRLGLFEVLPVSGAVRTALTDGADADTISAVARDAGWRPLREVGIDAAVNAQTTAAELLRVLMSDDEF